MLRDIPLYFITFHSIPFYPHIFMLKKKNDHITVLQYLQWGYPLVMTNIAMENHNF